MTSLSSSMFWALIFHRTRSYKEVIHETRGKWKCVSSCRSGSRSQGFPPTYTRRVHSRYVGTGRGGPLILETRGGLWWEIGGRGIEYSQEIKNKGLMWSFAFEPELTCWAWFTNDSLGQNPDCEEVTSPLAKSRVPLSFIVRHLRHFRSCWVRVYKDLDLIVWCTINAAVN